MNFNKLVLESLAEDLFWKGYSEIKSGTYIYYPNWKKLYMYENSKLDFIGNVKGKLDHDIMKKHFPYGFNSVWLAGGDQLARGIKDSKIRDNGIYVVSKEIRNKFPEFTWERKVIISEPIGEVNIDPEVKDNWGGIVGEL